MKAQAPWYHMINPFWHIARVEATQSTAVMTIEAEARGRDEALKSKIEDVRGQFMDFFNRVKPCGNCGHCIDVTANGPIRVREGMETKWVCRTCYISRKFAYTSIKEKDATS